ncbi:MAG: ATP synthase F1 subunit epsilon [Bdellovibrionales bacterium]
MPHTTFHFELVSPEKSLASKSVVMATIPGGKGEFGVLGNHAPVMTTVVPGVITLYENDETTVTERIFVAGGFADVSAERCIVLVEAATPVANLNREEAAAQVNELNEKIATLTDESQRETLDAQLELAKAKLHAASAA